MIESTSFTPSRLTLARQRRGMTQVQLAAEVDLTAQSLSNVERGRQDPSKATIAKIAECLDFPIEFFSSSDLEELQNVQISFRTRSKTSAKAKNAVRSAARIAVELKEWIDERFVVPTTDIPSIDAHMTPELAAEHVRARWGMDPMQSVSNCVHLVEAKGIAIFSLPPEYREVDAFSFWWREAPFIMLSTTKSAERSRFDAAHELGHLVMHRNAEYNRDWRLAEREANRFASAFLMPRHSVLKYISRPATTDRIIRGKRRWKVSAMALAYRLHELEFLPEWSYRQVVIELGRLGYRSGEPDGIVRETSQLLAKVFGALREDGISLTAVARNLNVGADELRHLTFGLVVRAAGAEVPASLDSRRPEVPCLRLMQGGVKGP
jgi:Zn-dependent peptidase ImmA (M78 family)/DNA-binding XRE family transcriptional regulator